MRSFLHWYSLRSLYVRFMIFVLIIIQLDRGELMKLQSTVKFVRKNRYWNIGDVTCQLFWFPRFFVTRRSFTNVVSRCSLHCRIQLMPQASSDFRASGPRCCLRRVPPIIQILKISSSPVEDGKYWRKISSVLCLSLRADGVWSVSLRKWGSAGRRASLDPHTEANPWPIRVPHGDGVRIRVRNSNQKLLVLLVRSFALLPISLLSRDSRYVWRNVSAVRCGATATAYAHCTGSGNETRGWSSWEHSRMRFDRSAMDVLSAASSSTARRHACFVFGRWWLNSPQLDFILMRLARSLARDISREYTPPFVHPSVGVKAPPMTFNEASIWRNGAEARMNRPLMANFRRSVSLPALSNAILRKIDERSLHCRKSG